MPIDHGQLLQCMEKLGYQIDNKGMCFGFAHAAMGAVLLGDLETYHKRLRILNDIFQDNTRNLEDEIEATRKLVKDKKKLTPEQKIIHSIPAFFDTVDMYQKINFYPELFEPNKQLYTQNAEKTFSRVLPLNLITREKIFDDEAKKMGNQRKS